ncbi:hypothetical protein B0H13DRAFT_1870973 [Mycena leptocephala]|nr:hypothetical protein B0H13DRAFT_1870973 [Mycena leptocephala]
MHSKKCRIQMSILEKITSKGTRTVLLSYQSFWVASQRRKDILTESDESDTTTVQPQINVYWSSRVFSGLLAEESADGVLCTCGSSGETLKSWIERAGKVLAIRGA